MFYARVGWGLVGSVKVGWGGSRCGEVDHAGVGWVCRGRVGISRVGWDDLIKWRHWGLPFGRHATTRLFHYLSLRVQQSLDRSQFQAAKQRLLRSHVLYGIEI